MNWTYMKAIAKRPVRTLRRYIVLLTSFGQGDSEVSCRWTERRRIDPNSWKRCFQAGFTLDESSDSTTLMPTPEIPFSILSAILALAQSVLLGRFGFFFSTTERRIVKS